MLFFIKIKKNIRIILLKKSLTYDIIIIVIKNNKYIYKRKENNMLETKELFKKYRPKKGKEVTAIDHISVRFPEKGMVFLLGKSGSGKSTLLNLLGGLDSYDEGEIIIKGISSRDFSQQRFDSYRNTYVGFIFQEYNVLEEFNVGANIALALELQGKKASDEEINRILHEVDLDGFGDRNPNELSGGQKQRVAIARALVKNPEIIMADEPTGALDSNTGKQVFETLKKLSADKLVIVVSHDREYAEKYADRIIELSDGKVIRDVESVSDGEITADSMTFREDTVEIPQGYRLTEEDAIRIREYINKISGSLKVTLPEEKTRFKDTDESVIPVQDGSQFKLIKSVLPMKSAFKIGTSSLKHKKFRLAMTIFLSVIAFTLFALVDTFSSYNHIRTCVDSLKDSDIKYISLSKKEKRGEGLDEWWANLSSGIKEEDLETITNETGIPVTGLFRSRIKELSFYNNTGSFDESEEEISMETCLHRFCGFAEISEDILEEMGYSIYAGRIPDPNKKEIAISCMAAETFIKAGYVQANPENNSEQQFIKNGSFDDENEGQKTERKKKPEKFSDPMYMVGKTLLLDNELYTVSAVIDTGFDFSRYELMNTPDDKLSTAENVLRYILSCEYDYAVNCSLTGAAMVGKGAVKEMASEEPVLYDSDRGHFSYMAYSSGNDSGLDIWSSYYAKLSDIPQEDIIWADAPVESLSENEIIVSLETINAYSGMKSVSFLPEDDEIKKEDLDRLLEYVSELDNSEGRYYVYGDPEDHKTEDVRIVGCLTSDSVYSSIGSMIIADSILDMIGEKPQGIYDCAIGPMPEDRNGMENVVRYCNKEGDDITEKYSMNNAVVYELDTFNSIIKTASKVFFWIGLFFAVFASILMANFISVSISYKKQEIGILRAIGSRSNDVFRIFFSESFVISVIEFVLTSVLCLVVVMIINNVLRSQIGILITILHFGIRQVILTLVISVAVAALASFFPVKKTASKKPIDAIRNR